MRVLRETIHTFGSAHQLRKAEEEMHELCVELDRIQDGRTSDEQIVTEIADVIVMMTQLAMIYGWEKVRAEIDRKIELLPGKMNKWAETHNVHRKNGFVTPLVHKEF